MGHLFVNMEFPRRTRHPNGDVDEILEEQNSYGDVDEILEEQDFLMDM